MKAIVWTRYGPPEVLEFKEVEKPVPKENEVLIRIYATTVTAGDCEMRDLKFPVYLSFPMRLWIGFSKPKENTIPGTELAGVVEAVGKDVRQFKPGDQVYGATGMRFGTNAEYICLPEKPGAMNEGVTFKPSNMSFEEAATVPFGGRDALHFIRLGNLQKGQEVLINGAGGSIGVFAVQLAKLSGTEVTAVDSTAKLEMLLSIGADHVIDYTKEDFTQKGVVYDVIFDVVGTIKLSKANRVLKREGTYLLANPVRGQLLQGMWTRLTGSKKVVMQTASGTVDDLVHLRELIEAGKLSTVIDRTYPLDQIVEAHRYVESGQKLGNLVIKV